MNYKINLILEELMKKIKLAELSLVAGCGKSGKTNFVVEMAKCAAKDGKQKVIFFSFPGYVTASASVTRPSFVLTETSFVCRQTSTPSCFKYCESVRITSEA